MTVCMGITTHTLVKTTEQLVETNGQHIKLDGGVFFSMTLADATISQLVYVTPQVICLFLSGNSCQELQVMPLDFPAHSARSGRVTGCTTVDSEADNIQGGN